MNTKYTVFIVNCILCVVKGAQHYSALGTDKFRNFAVDPTRSNVYIGSDKMLYKLDMNLNEQLTVCTLHEVIQTECSRSQRTNRNQILLIRSKGLVTCGLEFPDSCRLRGFSDLIANITSKNENIVANLSDDLNVAFFSNRGQNEILYVAKSYITEKLTSQVMGYSFITAWSLNSEFMISKDGIKDNTILRNENTDISLHYRSGFSYKNFVYFFTNWNTVSNSRYTISKLTQLCNNDETNAVRFSYIDMPIVCQSNGKNYSLLQDASLVAVVGELSIAMNVGDDEQIIAAVFTSSDDADMQPSSAVCLYKFVDVQRMLHENRKTWVINCTRTKHPYISQSKCSALDKFPETFDHPGMCSIVDTWLNIIGEIPLTAEAVFTSNDHLTTVTGEQLVNYSSVYVGSNSGVVHKLYLKNETDAVQYDTVTATSGHAVRAITAVEGALYILTEKELYKQDVTNCDQYENCEKCMYTGDPICGWCVFQNKCVRMDSCLKKNYWLPAVHHKCLTFTTDPKNIKVGEQKNITILLSRRLDLSSNDNVRCEIGSDLPVDAAVLDNGSLVCMAPTSKGRMTTNVTIFYNDIPIATGLLSYFSCSVPSTCSDCLAEDANCVWCIKNGKCYGDTITCSNNTVVRNEVFSDCPRLVNTSVYLPEGVKHVFRVEGRQLLNPVDLGNYSYYCHVSGEKMAASFINSTTLECGMHAYTYNQNEKLDQKKATVTFGPQEDDQNGVSSYEIENESGTEVILHLYKCQYLHSDCSRCLDPVDDYNCSWCSGSIETCQHPSKCSAEAKSCPPPVITSISPNMGLIDGGMLVTITGKELGSSIHDVNSVLFDNAECTVENFTVSKRIVCKTSRVNAANDVQVTVTISGQAKTSMDIFRYLDPQVTEIDPCEGIMAGETTVMVTVVNMPLENLRFPAYISPEIFFEVDDENRTCVMDLDNRIISSSDVTFKCTTPNASHLQEIKVFVKLTSNAYRELPAEKEFTYTVNPNITAVFPVKSFLSGGRQVTVEGTGFNNVYVHQIVDTAGNVQENCRKIDDAKVICKIPKAPDSIRAKVNRKKRDTKQAIGCVQCFTFTFKMDGFKQDYTFEYVIDPLFFNFSEPDFVKEFAPSEGTKLYIMGKNLTLAASKEDVTITVGNANCTSIILTEAEVSCVPPDEDPQNEGEHLSVVVILGNIKRQVGYLQYEKESFVLYIIIGVLVVVLVLVVLASLIIYRHVNQKKKEEFREIELLVVDRENELRDIWRNEFVKLVDCDDMTDIRSELVKSGLPFNDCQNYVFQVLFPSEQIKDHRLLQDPDVNGDKMVNLQRGMQIFEQLLFNKFFLEAAISLLDKQKKMRLKEKAEFSSVLSLILMRKMDYFTEVIKLLVSTLVEESMHKKQQRSLFRRVETISEKLLSFWMSLSMYHHVKLYAGSPLFMLYKAIQILMESNPIDAVSNDAKFTLMEDRILTNTEEAETLTLDVELNEKVFPCKVLKCDTIHQVKEKCLSAIYKNMHASKRPAADDVYLEWHEGKNGHIILNDIDETSEVELGWIRHNTLSHYVVKDGSRMVLLAKGDIGEDNNENIYVNILGPNDINASATSMEAVPISLPEEQPLNLRYWHLVKHHDDDNTRTAPKDMTEVYLPRLLSTKLYLMEYIETFHNTIFQTSEIPTCVKYLYDLLDELGDRHSLDSSVLHSWKSHSYIIRYWATLVNKPEMLFDIRKMVYVESCLDVVGQVLIDACGTSSPKYGKNSPMHKMLFKKEIKECQFQVKSFFKNVTVAGCSEQSIVDKMREQTEMFDQMLKFNKMAVLYEVYKVIEQFIDDIVVELEENEKTKHLQLGNKLETVQAIVNGEI